MLEIQAVIGRIQLNRMQRWTLERQTNAHFLISRLEPFATQSGPIRLPIWGCSSDCARQKDYICKRGCIHGLYKLYIYLRPERLLNGWSRDRIIKAINAEDVPCYQGSCSEVYREKSFDGTGWRPSVPMTVARGLGETSLMLPVHPGLTHTQMDKMITVLLRVLKEATAI
jgi:dTDP-4-amino-4,6-dideoxygalactose transaminase